MSVKSTQYLTRDEAEERYVERRQEQMARVLKAEASLLSDRELEDILEEMNDRARGGEGFENYLIRRE